MELLTTAETVTELVARVEGAAIVRPSGVECQYELLNEALAAARALAREVEIAIRGEAERAGDDFAGDERE